jgi:hypothetical protein
VRSLQKILGEPQASVPRNRAIGSDYTDAFTDVPNTDLLSDSDKERGVLRGGHFTNPTSSVRSADRINHQPTDRLNLNGSPSRENY